MSEQSRMQGTPWTEDDYKANGWHQLKVRVRYRTRQKLAALSRARGTSRGEVVEDLIAAEYARQERAKQ